MTILIQGKKSALAAEVARPDSSEKAKWLAEIHNKETKLPFSKIRTIMNSLYPTDQVSLANETAIARLNGLADIDKNNSHFFMRSYAGLLIPLGCSVAEIDRLSTAINDFGDLSRGTMRALRVIHQGAEQCVKIKSVMTVK